MKFGKPTEHIELKETQFGTKPVISGRRVTVENIGIMYENESDVDWIAENLELTHAQVHAALAYFYDNREAFEERIQEGIELVERIGTPLNAILNIEGESSSIEQVRHDSSAVVHIFQYQYDRSKPPYHVNYESHPKSKAIAKASGIAS